MLIRFTVENFRSFGAESIFSMIPGKMQLHQDHIYSGGDHGINVLSLGLLYGANASGKSNLVKAIEFARDLIVDGTRPKQVIPIQPFKLSKAGRVKPVKVEFEFMVAGHAYAYGFVTRQHRVVEEWLYEIDKSSDQIIFERNADAEEPLRFTFSESIWSSEEDRQFLRFVARGTRQNQLLLSEMAESNVVEIESIIEWFRNMGIVYPVSRHAGLQIDIYTDQKFSDSLTHFLKAMNTGIDEVCLAPVDLDSIGYPIELMEEHFAVIEESLKTKSERIFALMSPDGERFVLRQNENSEIEAFSLKTIRYANGIKTIFEIWEESDGTQRLFDLFPLLYGVRNRVFVIDELERSLHPNLVAKFLQYFLSSDSGNQLIVTTHESTLLNFELLRRDEIWFCEKSPEGNSTVYSLESFKPRHDLDVRKGYLNGRYGAIPVFGSSLTFSSEI